MKKGLVSEEGLACLALRAIHETSLCSAQNSPQDCFASRVQVPFSILQDLVSEEGLEPSRPVGHQPLKLARLPFRHSDKRT